MTVYSAPPDDCTQDCGWCQSCQSWDSCSTDCWTLWYWWTGTEIAWDMVTAITNNVNVQQAILDLVWDLSWARTCQDVADCISWNPETIWELTTLISSLIWDLNCDDVADCLSQTASITALANLVAWANDFKTAIVSLINTTADFWCDDVATCIDWNATVQSSLDNWLSGTIKKVWPITWSSWTSKSVVDADATASSIVMSRWISSGTQAWNWTWNSTSWNILFTSTAAENVEFYYILYI